MAACTTAFAAPTLQRSFNRRSCGLGARSVRVAASPMAFFGLKLGGGNAAEQRAKGKQELLDALVGLQRGLAASDEQKQQVEQLAQRLERANPTKKPLASELVNGQWELLYTTSGSILGEKRPALLRPSGPIYQVIDAPNLRARNKEGPPLFNQVSARLIPQSASKVEVQFEEFKLLGLIPVKAPASATGELEVTYLDEELRISRGNRGNLFVLRMADRGVKP